MIPEKIKSLHSRYNPRAEAERYITSLSVSKKSRFFILVEPGLCYLVNPIRKRFPGAKIIALHADEIPSPLPEGNPDSVWFPGAGDKLRDFLAKEIPDSEAEEIRIIEWRPALNIYGNAYRILVEEAALFIKHSDANVRTVKAFGKRWFRNFFRNLGIIRNVVYPFRCSLPMLITGAGPGLEEAVPAIREGVSRNAFRILAAASSAETLLSNKIVPDMLISTDGGNWAKYHLYEYIRHGRRRDFGLLAAALTAALPSQCGDMPLLPIGDGSLWQTLILSELGIPFINLPQRGTVTAAALDLALAVTEQTVFISGVDLANNDIRSHARPYSFDALTEEHAERFAPFYSLTFSRTRALNEGGSFRIYASWFEKQLSSYPKRLSALGNNNPLFDSLKNGAPAEREEVKSFVPSWQASSTYRSFTLKNGAAEKARGILLDTLKKHEPAPGQKKTLSTLLREELSALLFPGRNIPAPGELREAILTVTGTKTENNYD